MHGFWLKVNWEHFSQAVLLCLNKHEGDLGVHWYKFLSLKASPFP